MCDMRPNLDHVWCSGVEIDIYGKHQRHVGMDGGTTHLDENYNDSPYRTTSLTSCDVIITATFTTSVSGMKSVTLVSCECDRIRPSVRQEKLRPKAGATHPFLLLSLELLTCLHPQPPSPSHQYHLIHHWGHQPRVDIYFIILRHHSAVYNERDI